jgi:hypothetical protein
MNRMNREQRAHVLHLLCEGMSIRAITRLTPAMAAGMTDELREMSDLVAIAEAADKPAVRGPYKKK